MRNPHRVRPPHGTAEMRGEPHEVTPYTPQITRAWWPLVYYLGSILYLRVIYACSWEAAPLSLFLALTALGR